MNRVPAYSKTTAQHNHKLLAITLSKRSASKGFTLIELLLVVGIMGILFTMATFNLVTVQHAASITATVDQLVADIHTQQTKAMIGAKDTTGVENSYGISISGSSYTLFQGSSEINDPSDFTVTPAGITFTNTLPGNIAVFGERKGEICIGTCGPYTITVKSASSTQQRVLTINKYGVIISNVLQ